MMNEENNIDKLFREKLENFSENPPAFVWDGIKEKLAQGRRKKFVAWYGWAAIAALLVLAFIAGWYFNESSESVIPQVAEKEAVKSLHEDTSGNEDVPAKPLFKGEENDTENQNAKFRADAGNIESTSEGVDAGEAAGGLAESNKSVLRENLKIPEKIIPVEATLIAENSTVNTEEEVLIGNSFGLSQSERETLARNAASYTETGKNETGWKMGVNVSPGYSSYSAKYGNSYASNMTQVNNEGNASMSGGVVVRYRTSSRWSVESGIYYAQNGQHTGSSPHLFGGNREADFYATPEKMHFNTAVKMESGHLAINSIAGVIEIDNLPAGAEIAANPEYAANLDNSLVTQGEISQVFDLIEIPFYLRYLLIDSKLDVELMGGINAGVVVGNNAFIDNQFGVQNIGQTGDISPLNVSGTVGLGFNYGLGKHFSLAMEPRLNYYMNSISRNPEVDFRPYRVGIYTGLYYSF